MVKTFRDVKVGDYLYGIQFGIVFDYADDIQVKEYKTRITNIVEREKSIVITVLNAESRSQSVSIGKRHEFCNVGFCDYVFVSPKVRDRELLSLISYRIMSCISEKRKSSIIEKHVNYLHDKIKEIHNRKY